MECFEEEYIKDLQNTISVMMYEVKKRGFEPSRPAKYRNSFWQGYESSKDVLINYFFAAIKAGDQTMIHQAIEMAQFMEEAFVMLKHIGKVAPILTKYFGVNQEEAPTQ